MAVGIRIETVYLLVVIHYATFLKKLGIEICVHVPRNYVDSLASARPSQPYTVHYVDNGFLRKYSELSFYSSIRPGSKVGDQVVTDLRVLHCNPDGTV
jgi:hypothetical protein